MTGIADRVVNPVEGKDHVAEGGVVITPELSRQLDQYRMPAEFGIGEWVWAAALVAIFVALAAWLSFWKRSAENLKSKLTTAATVCLLMLLAGGYYFLWYSPKEAKKEQAWASHQGRVSERVAKGAYVAKTSEVAPGQTVQLVVIPNSTGIDVLDTRCLIYTHSEFKQSQMICPDAKQYDLDQ